MIKNILLIVGLIILGLYGISVVPTLSGRMQLAAVISCIYIISLAIIYPKIDFGFKFILIIISGYMLFGKRFAYLSPFEPIFISEICLAVSFIIVLGKILSKGLWGKLFDTPLHIIIWLLLIYGALHLYLGFPRYGIVAIKDSATIYYSLFFLISYILFQNKQLFYIFEKYLMWLFIIGLIGLIINRSYIPVISAFPFKDAYIGAASAGFLVIYFKTIRDRYYLGYIYLGIAIVFIMAALNMSVIWSLGFAALLICIWARKYQLLYLLFAGVIFGGLFTAVISALNPAIFERIISEFDSMNLADLNITTYQGSSTSGWRVAWWLAIWRETMLVNPWWGQGFGADLGSEFTLAFYGKAYGEFGNQAFGAARYPHNILFTVIGRLGLIGALLFIIYSTILLSYIYKFCKLFCSKSLYKIKLIDIGIVAYIAASFANAFVQCTYEAPYSAIPHWVMIAYMIVKIKNAKTLLTH